MRMYVYKCDLVRYTGRARHIEFFKIHDFFHLISFFLVNYYE